MSLFSSPHIILFTQDLPRAVAFYQAMGFTEVFRVPADGPAVHVDVELDGYRIGFATEGTSREDHGLEPVTHGHTAVVVLWTTDAATAYARLTGLGARPLQPPRPFLDRLLVAWVEDPDGHAIQLVQEAAPRS